MKRTIDTVNVMDKGSVKGVKVQLELGDASNGYEPGTILDANAIIDLLRKLGLIN